MPLTSFQQRVVTLIAQNRTLDSYLAGGAALHQLPDSIRFSQDLDYFHDTSERVASAFQQDQAILEAHGIQVKPDILQPGYIRAQVIEQTEATKVQTEATKVEWAHDSCWRFMPVQSDPEVGFKLHPIDVSTNKLLALVGREEPRDLIDVMFIHTHLLKLGPLIWAACGKDPGFTPLSLLKMVQRRGRLRPEDLERLHLREPIHLQDFKTVWLEACEDAGRFVAERPMQESGCLYYSRSKKCFVDPRDDRDAVPHFGKLGGVLPTVV